MPARPDNRTLERWPRAIAAAFAGIALAVSVGTASADTVRVGSEAEVTADDGVNLRLKADASSTLVAVVGPAHIVLVIEGPTTSDLGDWYQVDHHGDVGWVLGSYLGPARSRAGVSRGDVGRRPSDDEALTAGPIKVGAEAQVATDDGIRLRARPGLEGDVLGIVKGTRFLYVLDGPELFESGPWYKVDYDGSVGWVNGRYIQPARPREAPPSERPAAPAAAPSPTSDAKAASSLDSGRGATIARKALGLVGLRYAWGGNAPSTGFDCSGLVNYVMNAYGVYPGRTSYVQAGAGRSVGSDDLQPGDIVVFANTYAGGYDHTGIYVGGGRFVHAEDYGTGVVVSSVFGGYWGRHYAGARRPW